MSNKEIWVDIQHAKTECSLFLFYEVSLICIHNIILLYLCQNTINVYKLKQTIKNINFFEFLVSVWYLEKSQNFANPYKIK